jgi:hypothetical protein
MSSVDPKIIQGIRVRKQAQELLSKASEFQALSARLVEISGIKERGIDPSEITISDDYLPTLLEAAQNTLKDETLFSNETSQNNASVNPNRIKRIQI